MYDMKEKMDCMLGVFLIVCRSTVHLFTELKLITILLPDHILR
jgi:hypothetical protein